ncbi:protein lin-28 homolog B-like [Narcine bancroftii]|uniref:protein lin-28 homolog B-like n=1 Tax=Narcine bancroftii TaxID=1343680 RepID=UPI003831F318
MPRPLQILSGLGTNVWRRGIPAFEPLSVCATRCGRNMSMCPLQVETNRGGGFQSSPSELAEIQLQFKATAFKAYNFPGNFHQPASGQVRSTKPGHQGHGRMQRLGARAAKQHQWPNLRLHEGLRPEPSPPADAAQRAVFLQQIAPSTGLECNSTLGKSNCSVLIGQQELRGGGAGKGGGDEKGKLTEREDSCPPVQQGAGHCKWFNVRMGFGFISMTSREGNPLETPVDVFVHQSKLYMEGFRSLKEGEPVEFTFKKSCKGLESIRVTGPGGTPCSGSERRPKGKTVQKRKPKGDRISSHTGILLQTSLRCYNCGGLDHHAKECSLPPQPKKCHFCQSIMHMVANCPLKTVPPQSLIPQGKYEADPQPSTSSHAACPREVGGAQGYPALAHLQEEKPETENSGKSSHEASACPEEACRKGSSNQKRKKTESK